jgi:hypothetical protein
MSKTPIQELFSQLQERIILNPGKDEVVCPECKGLTFVLKVNEDCTSASIERCAKCYTGKLFVCKHCSKQNRTNHCDCAKAVQERNNDRVLEQAQKDAERYQKAEKINYTDYDGYFILPGNEHLKELEDVEEWIYEVLTDGGEPPEYLWAVEGEKHFHIDLLDVINDKCEDGYEDMYDQLGTDSPLLDQAQILINTWEENQGDSLFIFNETYKKAVIIKDLVEKIKREIEQGGEK